MRIKLRFCEEVSNIKLSFAEEGIRVKYKFTDTFVNSKPDYTGTYTVTPTFNIQTLFTKDKSMDDDVTIYAIPVSEVSNPQNGITMTIGV